MHHGQLAQHEVLLVLLRVEVGDRARPEQVRVWILVDLDFVDALSHLVSNQNARNQLLFGDAVKCPILEVALQALTPHYLHQQVLRRQE